MILYDFFASQKWVLIGLFLLGISACSPRYYFKKQANLECKIESEGFYAGTMTTSYSKYVLFRDNKSIKKLKKYTNSKNLYLRTYAYWALLEKMDNGYLEFFDKAIYEKEHVIQNCQGVVSKKSIAYTAYANYLINQLGSNYDPENEEIIFIGDMKKLYELDSLILNHPIKDEGLIYMATNNGIYIPN